MMEIQRYLEWTAFRGVGIKIRELSAGQIQSYCNLTSNAQHHHVFHEAVIRFIEFNGYRVGETLMDTYGDDSSQIMVLLNAYLKRNLINENPDIRIINLVLKFSSPFLGLATLRNKQLFANLSLLVNDFFAD